MNGTSKLADRRLSSWSQVVALIKSDSVVWWCSQWRLKVQLLVWPLLALFICSQLQTPAPENTICGKKWLVEKLTFFMAKNFLGILNRVCMEPLRRSHDFLSLTLVVVGSTPGRCYFLQQYRCLPAYVLCVVSS